MTTVTADNSTNDSRAGGGDVAMTVGVVGYSVDDNGGVVTTTTTALYRN